MKVLKNEPLKLHTSFRAGGPAKCYVVPESCEELQALIAFLYREKLPYLILGNGSNLLVSDEGVDCVVVEIGKAMEELQLDGCRLMVSAGTLLGKAAAFAAEHGLSGMEELRGIPGTVGGACMMNAGAHGREMKDVLEAVEVLTPEGELLHLPAEALELSYRHSNLAEKGLIVVRAWLRLEKAADPDQIYQQMKLYAEKRKASQPLEFPSAGSTFKRPEGDFAGRLIEAAGLKGFRIGGACVSEKHAGFVVNDQNGTALDIRAVIDAVQKEVYEQSGVRLELEVRTWGNF